MPKAKSNGIELEYDTLGDPDDPALLLIMGLGAQLIDWPQGFCEQLVAAGFHVIRFDNRDAGLSTSLDELGVPDLAAILSGRPAQPPYLLADFAADTAGLLDALDIDRAHVLGASLGGMVAQQLTIDHPQRVRSLCSVMSMTGDHSVGRATPEAAAVLGRPPVSSREEAIANGLLSARVIGSPGYPTPEEELLRRITAKFDRSYRPLGTMRQYAAAAASPDRTAALGGVTAPTVVIHGEADPLIDMSGGRATAAAIPDAELIVIPGMGHDLPRALWPQIVAAVRRNALRV